MVELFLGTQRNLRDSAEYVKLLDIRGLKFKEGGGSHHDRNRHNCQDCQNSQKHCLFVLYFEGLARGGQYALQSHQHGQNRHNNRHGHQMPKNVRPNFCTNKKHVNIIFTGLSRDFWGGLFMCLLTQKESPPQTTY